MKEGLNTYQKAYKKIEEGLEEKGEATSSELISWLITNYNIHSLNITSKGVTYYLKAQGYRRYKQYDTKPWIFCYNKED